MSAPRYGGPRGSIVLLSLITTTTVTTGAFGAGWEEVGCRLSSGGVMDCTASQTGGTLSSIPSGLPADIVHLWLSDNRIASVNDGDLAGLSALRYLYLDGNIISSISGTAFKDLVDLRFLLLDGNRLTGLPSGLFVKSTKIAHLDLRNNDLSEITPGNFVGLVEIRHLNLFGNKISEIRCGSFNPLQSATYLNGEGNPSVCGPADDGALMCDCSDPAMTGGTIGFCSTQDSSCSFKPPVFEGLISTSTASSGIQRFFVGNETVTSNPGDNANLEADARSDKDNSDGSNAGLAAAIALCVVAVLALFGTVFVRARNSQHQKITLASSVSGDTASSIESGPITSGRAKSDHIELHWDDGATDTDAEWIQAPNANNNLDDDIQSQTTQTSAASSATVKSSILDKFMNLATKVWTKDKYEYGARKQNEYPQSNMRSQVSTGTSVPAIENSVINTESEPPQQLNSVTVDIV